MNMLKCKICNQEFKNRTSLCNHLTRIHNLDKKSYYDQYLKKDGEEFCPICGKPLTFLNIEDGYRDGCCMEHTNIVRHGENYAKRLEETRRKISESVSSEECQSKIKQTNLERHGQERYTNPEKRKQTVLKKYGVDNASKTKAVKQKIEQTKLDRYGDKHYNNREQGTQTMLERYGVTAPMKSKEIQNKSKQSCIKKYGVPYSLQAPEVKEKIKQTNVQKYGVEYQTQSTNFKVKSKQTRLNKYEDETFNNRPQAWKTCQQNISLFEQEHNCTLKNTLLKKYGQGWLRIEDTLSHLSLGKYQFILNSDISKIEEYYKSKPDGGSYLEDSLFDYITSIYEGEIIRNTRQVIPPYELDIYIPDKKLAIEFNGTYWHSWPQNIVKTYHYDKSIKCQDKGIRLIHIYEWEVLEPQWSKIKLMLDQALGVNSKIYARNCTIKPISNNEAKILNEKVHLQGHRPAQVTYGLFYRNQLVQLMSFSRTRYNRNLKSDDDWEIIRGCPGGNCSVVGGVSKLFQHFVQDFQPKKVFSYCDFNKFDGTSYEKLGMRFIGYTGPDKTWIIGGKPVKRNPKRYQQLKSNAEGIMWGSGSKKYEWIAT